MNSLSELKSSKYTLYPTRFIVAILLCLSSGLSGYILANFVSIWTMSMDYFDVDSMGINMFSLVYMIFFLPSSLLSIYTTERFGVGVAITLGATLNCIGCWIRYGGSNHSDPSSAYGIVLFGQIIAAIAQPLLLNAPPRIANDWFPYPERDLIMHLMTQSNNIGGGLGTLIPAYQITVEKDIPLVLLWPAVASVGIVLLTLTFVRDRPPSPPGLEVEKQIEVRSRLDTMGVMKLITQMFKDFLVMLQKPNFMLLLLSFSCELGVSWAFMAVVGQMITPCNYDTHTVGIAGSCLFFAGVVGSFAIAALLTSPLHKYHLEIQKLVYLAIMATAIWCLGSNKPGNLSLVLASWTVFGFFQGPLIPLCLEQGVEIMYPIPADSVAALMFTGVNWVCLALTLGLTPLLTYDVSLNCTSVVSPASALVFFFAILGAALGLMVRPEYHRQEAAEVVSSTQKSLSDDVLIERITTQL